MTESWVPIFEYPKYEVSDRGNVRNRLTGRILRPQRVGQGLPYLQVSLSMNGVVEQRKIHRLVAAAYIGVVPIGMTVNHKDGDKLNNFVSNLEIVSYSQNNRHAFAMGLKQSTKANKPVRCIDTGEEFESVKQAAAHIGASPSEITNMLHHRQRTVRGMQFELINH